MEDVGINYNPYNNTETIRGGYNLYKTFPISYKNR